MGVFVFLTVLLLVVSRRSLSNPSSHGFYRFFAFEGILILLLLNAPFWFEKPFSPRQLLSWGLLFFSVYLVGRGFYLLRKLGGSRYRESNPENLDFENTLRLVKVGVYKYIRHPMYCSLLLLVWGAFLKNISIQGLYAALIVTVFLFITAKIEERENLHFFGLQYQEYIQETRMFIPCLL